MRHQATKQKQLVAKQEKEIRELEECTFQPSINSRSEFYARRLRGGIIEPLPERLFHEADKRSTLRNKAKEMMEADAMCDYTFQPHINRTQATSKATSSKDDGRAPIHLRAEAIKRKKQENIRTVQRAEEQRSECFFQPRISRKSERLVQQKRDRLYREASKGNMDCLKQLGPVEERLYAEAQEKEQRHAALQDFLGDSTQSVPSVDDTSRRICKDSVYFQGAQQDFITRQQTFELARQRRMEVRSQHADAECSFRPAITEASRHIIASNLELVGETPEERVTRLAVQDAARRDQVREELEQFYQREYTFKPEINPVSEMLAASRYDNSASYAHGLDVSDSYTHERLYRTGLAKSRLNEDSRMDECTFRPQLDARSCKRFAHIKPHYANTPDLMESIRQEQDKKAECLLERRRELEEAHQTDLTFAPQVGDGYKEPEAPIVVSGLGRFYELKGLALKKQQELQEREAKVFRPELGGVRCNGVTIPEPFNLSSGHCSHPHTGHAEAEDSHWSERHQDCTFAPETNETQNRELIRQIMGTVEVH
jgi:hypothetical protein